MEKEIKITVSGCSNTGKSRLLFLVKRFLIEQGFDVEYDTSFDYPTEKTFDKCMIKNLDESIGIIKKNSKIFITEKQVNRNINNDDNSI